MTITTAMVLAAGQGKRMRPITNTIPKPLVPVCGVTLLDRILDNLAEAGIQKAVVNGHYLADVLEKHLAARSNANHSPTLIYSYEDTVLETGGGIAKALPLLGNEPFFIINGDVLWLDGTTPLLHTMMKTWNETTMDALLALHPVEKAIGYEGAGDFALRGDGVLLRPETEARPYVFAGVSIIHPRIFIDLPLPPFSLNQLFWRAQQKDNSLHRFHGVVHTGEWLHIGTPEGLAEAENFLQHA